MATHYLFVSVLSTSYLLEKNSSSDGGVTSITDQV